METSSRKRLRGVRLFCLATRPTAQPMMAKMPTPESIAAGLTAAERTLVAPRHRNRLAKARHTRHCAGKAKIVLTSSAIPARP
jgi:hypothetical protein